MTAPARVEVPRGPLRGYAYFVDFAGSSPQPPWWAFGLLLVGAVVAVLR